MLNGLGKIGGANIKGSTGRPSGGGKGSDDDGSGDGGGDRGDDGGGGHIFLLPLLTLAFAAFRLGYCIAVWVKDESLNNDFFRTDFGLFCLLVLAKIQLNNRTGIDAYILGLRAFIGVMVWTRERCFVKQEGNPARIVALFTASMAVMIILHGREPTWTGHVAGKNHTYTILALSISTTLRQHPCIW